MDCTATAAPPDDLDAPLEDWSALVTELSDQHGMSQREIGAFCGCGQTAISELARKVTNDPRHRIGERLKDLRTAKRSEAAKKAVAPAAPSIGAGLAVGAGA
jgi:predicted transcriptional regulator